MNRFSPFMLISLVMLTITGCQKNFDTEVQAEGPADKPIIAPQLAASVSKTVLLARNAGNTAVSFSWPAFAGEGNGEHYAIEMDMAGEQFAHAVLIDTTSGHRLTLTVGALNQQLRKKSTPGAIAQFEFRIRMDRRGAAPVYSKCATVEASSYDEYREFPASETFLLPGNYQNWQVETAPKIVSPAADGAYEGYVYMPAAKPMFLLVKNDTQSGDLNVYYDLGEGRFGKGQDAFVLPSDGVYKVKLNLNTNQVSAVRIDEFSMHGNAVAKQDIAMVYDANAQTWSLTTDLAPGNFYFRSNASEQDKLGADNQDMVGSLRSDGAPISVRQAGKYKIVLSVLNAGNYRYTMQRIP